jgi:hypothetical protein
MPEALTPAASDRGADGRQTKCSTPQQHHRAAGLVAAQLLPAVDRRGALPHLVQAQAGGVRKMSADRYSMTWSARASSDGGIVRPRALAVLRLMMSSNAVGC